MTRRTTRCSVRPVTFGWRSAAATHCVPIAGTGRRDLHKCCSQLKPAEHPRERPDGAWPSKTESLIGNLKSQIENTLMPFDPTLPVIHSKIRSAELRDQFNGLKDLIDSQTLSVASLTGRCDGLD